jgi:hypothetical protein
MSHTTWEESAVLIFRALIGDLDSGNYTYSDERLMDVLIVSAHFVTAELSFTETYVVDVPDQTITPDPVNDEDFINFVTLKAACIIDRGNARIAAATDGINAKCGPVGMTVNGRMQSYVSLLQNGYCAEYAKASIQYSIGNASYIRAVLSPFISSTFDPTIYSPNTNNRR